MDIETLNCFSDGRGAISVYLMQLVTGILTALGGCPQCQPRNAKPLLMNDSSGLPIEVDIKKLPKSEVHCGPLGLRC